MKRFDLVLGFSQHRLTFPTMSNLAQHGSRATGISTVWRRVPITTATLLLVLSVWVWDRVMLLQAAGSTQPLALLAPEYPPQELTRAPVSVSFDARRHHTRSHLPKRSPIKPGTGRLGLVRQSAFKEKIAGSEVDYFAKDVTIRLFAAKPELRPDSKPVRQVKMGEDVTVRYFDHSEQARRALAPSAQATVLDSK